MEQTTANRMVLSLRSGIPDEVHWAIDRLVRLTTVTKNENFSLQRFPGLTDALFEWPMWYVQEGHRYTSTATAIFAVPSEAKRKQRFALDSLLLLRNSALQDLSLTDLLRHHLTLPFIELALQSLDILKPSNAEFLILVLDLFHAVGATVVISQTLPANHYMHVLQRMVSESPNRTLIISSFSMLNLLLSNPLNAHHVLSTNRALNASARYLPLFADDELVDACVNFFYTHLSVMATAKDFLLREDLSSILRLLVSVLLHQQEQKIAFDDIAVPYTSVPALSLAWPNHELTEGEFNRLMTLSEPTRCHEW